MKKKNKLINYIIVGLLSFAPVTVLANGTTGCGILGDTNGKTVQILSWGFKLIRLGVPVLIIVLGMTDFFKIVFSGEEKIFKESFNRFVKRIGIGMAFIFVPYVIFFLVKVSGVDVQYDIDNFYCGIMETTSGVKGTPTVNTCDCETGCSCGGNTSSQEACKAGCRRNYNSCAAECDRDAKSNTIATNECIKGRCSKYLID